MKKNWTKIAVALGPALIIASVFWEFARMQPDYKFLIEPWSMKGTEMIHGDVFFTLGVLLLIAGVATSWEKATKPLYSAAITVFIVAAAVGVAAVYADKDVSVTINLVYAGILSLILASALSVGLKSRLRDKSGLFKRALPLFGVLFVVLLGIMLATVVDTTVTMAAWTAILIVMGYFGALVLTLRPTDMAANRMLIIGNVAVWATITASAGAMRSTLMTTQLELNGISAQYKDTQAALGWWIAGFGVTLAFVGAVGLWAKRRDYVAAIARAKKQRAAADKSTREIQEALDSYEAEIAARASSGSTDA